MAIQEYEITPPIVHLNGTGKKSLEADYDRVDDSFSLFIDDWEKMEFNARDFYPKGPEYWQAARAHRDEINKKIREISDYITAHRIHFSELP